MKSSRVLSWTLLVALLASAGFLVDGALAANARLRTRDAALRKLREARALALRHPTVFRGESAPSQDVPLKALVQKSARKHGLRIAFLSEAEREAGKGVRERQVSVRFTGSPHSKFVLFLLELEEEGAGAKVKELHLRPSKDTSDVYQDGEIVFSKFLAAPEKKP